MNNVRIFLINIINTLNLDKLEELRNVLQDVLALVAQRENELRQKEWKKNNGGK